MQYSTCSLSPVEYKDLIYKTLLDVDFCAADYIDPQVIDFYWHLQKCWSRCDTELQYLLTRREAVKLLMGCNVYQIDRSGSVSESNSTSSSESCADGWTQSQSNSHSANWSDSLAEAKSDTSGTSRGESESSTTSYTESHSNQSGKSDTTGFSTSYADGLSDSFSNSRSESTGESLSTKEDGGGIGTYSMSEDYVQNHSRTEGIGASFGIIGAGRSATRGEEHTFARSDDIDDGKESRFGHSLSNVRSSNAGQTISTSGSHSFNQAISDTFAQSTSVNDGATVGGGSGSSTSHSEGLAQSSAETRNRGTTSGQNTNQGHNENSSKSKANSVSSSSGFAYKYNQRFKHLSQMYDNLTLLIEYKLQAIKRGQKVSYGRIVCQPLCDREYVPEIICQNRLGIQSTMDGQNFWLTV